MAAPMAALLRPAGNAHRASELGRAEAAARIAMVMETDDALGFAPRAGTGVYRYCSAGLALTFALLGVVFLLGPA